MLTIPCSVRPPCWQQSWKGLRGLSTNPTTVKSRGCSPSAGPCSAKTPGRAESSTNKLNYDLGQRLIALHRILLREHYRFFRYSTMPARMWRRRVRTLFERLWQRLMESLDHGHPYVYLHCLLDDGLVLRDGSCF
jgi:hypothetical protein